MPSQLSHILFITKIAPFPPYGGEKIRSIELIKLLSAYTDRFTVISPQSPKNPSAYGIESNVHFVPIRPNKRSKISQAWHNRAGFFQLDKAITERIDQVCARQPVTLAFIDYEFLGQYIPYLRKKGVSKIVYGTHNAQSRLTIQEHKTTWLARLDTRVKYYLHLLHERRYLPMADQLVVVSEEDATFHAEFVSRSKILLLPNFLDERTYQFGTATKRERLNQVVMTANFLSFQNARGATWFLNYVWRGDISTKFQLVLAGLGSKDFFTQFCQDYHTPNNCTALGEIEDAKTLITSSLCAVVPLLHGSGSRLKVVEALALGVPIVATSIGAEGVRHQGTILTADTAHEFKERLSYLDDMSEEAYTQLREKLREVFHYHYSRHASQEIAETIVSTSSKIKS